jgi:hypothetical protein
MAKETSKSTAEKKIVITDLEAAIGDLFDQNADAVKNLRSAISAGLVKAEIAEVKVEEGKYSGDYVKLSLGDKATDSDSVMLAMMAIAAGNLTTPKGDDGEDDDRAPAVTKWFLYGADLASRSRTSQQVKAAAEGPDKAIEKMAQTIVKNNPKISLERAREKARLALEE